MRFVEQAGSQLEQVKQALSAGDWLAVRELSQRLIGVLRSVG